MIVLSYVGRELQASSKAIGTCQKLRSFPRDEKSFIVSCTRSPLPIFCPNLHFKHYSSLFICFSFANCQNNQLKNRNASNSDLTAWQIIKQLIWSSFGLLFTDTNNTFQLPKDWNCSITVTLFKKEI